MANWCPHFRTRHLSRIGFVDKAANSTLHSISHVHDFFAGVTELAAMDPVVVNDVKSMRSCRDVRVLRQSGLCLPLQRFLAPPLCGKTRHQMSTNIYLSQARTPRERAHLRISVSVELW
jgi:hypothetical protein